MYDLNDYPEIRDQFYLSGRDKGFCKKPRGNVFLTSCFMKRSEKEFKHKTISNYLTELDKKTM